MVASWRDSGRGQKGLGRRDYKSFGGDGFVHYHDCDDGFMDVYTFQNVSKYPLCYVQCMTACKAVLKNSYYLGSKYSK